MAKAASLAADLPALAALRGGLRERMLASPLCDGPGFVRRLEGVYRDLWHRWLRREGNSGRGPAVRAGAERQCP